MSGNSRILFETFSVLNVCFAVQGSSSYISYIYVWCQTPCAQIQILRVILRYISATLDLIYMYVINQMKYFVPSCMYLPEAKLTIKFGGVFLDDAIKIARKIYFLCWQMWRRLIHSETCIKRPLNVMVSQDRWCFTTRGIKWFCKGCARQMMKCMWS